jgi:hypothetical protein
MLFSVRSVLCSAVVAALVFGVAGSPARDVPTASAVGDDPTILLDSITVDARIETPLFEQPVMPESVHLGYGFVQPKSFDHTYTDVIFDEHSIVPSTESQVLYAYTDQDPDAAALVLDLNRSLPQYTFLGVIDWFEQPSGGTHSTEAFGNPNIVFHTSPGARVSYFEMTVAPFTIEKRIVDPFHGGVPSGQDSTATIQPRVIIQPYSVWRIITDGPVATIDAYGPPPPGDATCNAAIDSLDALLVLQRGAALIPIVPCEKAADVNADRSIDSLDAQLILQFVAGLIPQL